MGAELRLYLQSNLSDDALRTIEQGVVTQGIALLDPVEQGPRIVRVEVEFGQPALAVLSRMEWPGPLAWRLFKIG